MITEDGVAQATTRNETLTFIPAGDGQLFGILTEPTSPANGVAVLICSSSHWVASIGANRIYVRLARRLAADGFHVFRFDYLGIGESTGTTREYTVGNPFVGDAEAALEWLRARGLKRFVVMGPCYGARVAMATAVAHEDVIALAMFPPVTREYEHAKRVESLPTSEILRRGLRFKTLRRLRDPKRRRRYVRALKNKTRRLFEKISNRLRGRKPEPGQRFEWVAPFFIEDMGALVDRQLPVLLLMGDDDDFYMSFARGAKGELGKVLERGGDRVVREIVVGNTHGLNTIGIQDEVLDHLEAWLLHVAA